MSQNFRKDINKYNKYTFQVGSECQLEVYTWMTKKFLKKEWRAFAVGYGKTIWWMKTVWYWSKKKELAEKE